MKNNIFLIGVLYFLINTTGFAQQWTEPVSISNSTENYNHDSKFCIDSSGTIHCIWRYLVPWHPEQTRIFYSKSLNDGESWEEPEIVNKDEEDVTLYEPAIAVNSKGDVTITYTKGGYYTSSYICLAYKQSNNWHEDTVSTGMPGSRRPLIACDNTDVFYLLWFHGGPYGNIYYRKRHIDGTMSPIMDMLVDTNLNSAFGELVFDRMNNLHFMGGHNKYLNQSEDTKAAYYIFDGETCRIQKLFGTDYTPFATIAIDNNQQAVVSWMQKGFNWNLGNDCYISKNIDGFWTEGELVSQRVHDYSLCLDNQDNVHFFITTGESAEDESSLYYYAPMQNSWEKYYLDDSESFYTHVHSIHYKNGLHIIYEDCSYNEDSTVRYSNILFRKTDLISSYGDEKPPKGEINIYPNPFRGKLNINGFFGMGETTQLEIFTYDGILVFSGQLETAEEGTFNYSWNGETSSGTKLQEGIYLLRLSSGESVVCKTIISIN